MSVINLQKNNPYIYIEDNGVHLSNGDFALVYFLELPEKYTLSESDYIQTINYWFKGLKNLPYNTIFFKQDIFLNKKYNSSHIAGNHFLRKYTRIFFQDRDYLEHLCLVYFILPKGDTFKNLNIKNPFKIVKQLQFKELDNRIEVFKKNVEINIEYFNSNKISNHKILFKKAEENIINWLKTSFFNGFQEGYNTDFNAKDKDSIQIGDKHYGTLCLTHEQNFPEELSVSIKDLDFSSGDFSFYKTYGEDFALSLKFNHIYNQVFFLDDPKRHLELIKLNHLKFIQARGFSPENKHNAESLGATIKEIINTENYHFYRGHNSIIYWGDSKEDIEVYKNEIISKYRQSDFTPYYPIGNNKNILFLSAFFAYTSAIPNRFLFYTSLKAGISLLNNTTNYKNDKKGILLNDRIYNLPVMVDTWDEEKKNIRARNFFIVAPTGSGKSFLANHIFSQFYEQGITLVLVDLGGSYQKLAYLYPNETVYIRYQEGRSLNLNPFYLEYGKKITTNKVNELAQFIFLHTKRSEESTEIEKKSLRTIISKYYEIHNKDYSFTNFIEWVSFHKNNILKDCKIEDRFFDIEEFVLLLSDFINNGLYSFLYKKEDKTEHNLLGKKFIVFELDQAKDDPLLLSILLQLISITIQKTIWEDKKNKGIIFFDEAAKQLEFPNVLNQIAYINQTIRKYNGAIGLALQTINQLPDNEKGKSIIENTQVLYVLKNDRGYQSIKERFNLSKHQLYQMMSISDNFNTKKPYSSVFILRGVYGNVYHLQVPKEVFWAYQTEGRENAFLLERYKKIGDMEKAILEHLNS